MNDAQIEDRMLAEYFVWLAFTAEGVPTMATPRWQVTQRACQAFFNGRRR